MEDYELSDCECPRCGHSPTHSRDCYDCDEMHEECDCIDDICQESGHCIHGDGMVPCRECNGTGIVRWCPKCGADYWQAQKNHETLKKVGALASKLMRMGWTEQQIIDRIFQPQATERNDDEG